METGLPNNSLDLLFEGTFKDLGSDLDMRFSISFLMNCFNENLADLGCLEFLEIIFPQIPREKGIFVYSTYILANDKTMCMSTYLPTLPTYLPT